MIELWFRDELICEVESVRLGDVVDPSGLGDDWYVVAEIRHERASEVGPWFRTVGQLERPSNFERAVRDARSTPPAQRDDIADALRSELEKKGSKL